VRRFVVRRDEVRSEEDSLMRRPLQGVRVVELAMWGFVPSGAAVLADWGADVVKVEHAVTGDPQRGLHQMGAAKVEGRPNAAFDHPNRGKRSIGLDLTKPEGLDVLYALVKKSDVFITSLRAGALRRLGVDVDDLRAQNPAIIYARGTAFGTRGPDAEAGGFDMTAFWCRASTAASLTPSNVEGVVPPPAPAYGDTISGTNLAGGIAVALFARERTGEPSVVDVSLLSSGLWSMGMGVDLALASGRPWQTGPAGAGVAPTNPLSGLYATADGRYITLVMLQPDRYWADFCRHIDRADLADDERFATAAALTEHAAEAADLIRAAFAGRTLTEWRQRFATLDGAWAPVQDTLEVTTDPQVRANGYIVSVTPEGESSFDLVASPVQFDDVELELGPSPEFAQHTEEILLELGVDWEQISALKDAGAIA
jgi:crotonobetainyl-CoA:carnitine CoA-transferase CaiB-like acyl-CoA transferase